MSNKLNVPSMWTEAMGQVIAKQNELAAGAYVTGQSIADMRDAYNIERAFWNEGGPQSYSTEDDAIPTEFGRIKVRMYRPTSEKVLPVILYIHGGGLVLGGLDTHDRITRKLADATGAAVIAIDYTLSPDSKFPQAIQECAAVYQSAKINHRRWGIDPQDISFAGDSGGAYLSAATYLWLRDKHGLTRIAQSLLLFYGTYGLQDSASMRLFGGPWDGLTQEDFAWYMDMYRTKDSDLASPFYNILGADLTKPLPPTLIVSANLDPLLDDSRALFEVLTEHGTTSKYVEVPGVIHGFLHHGRMLNEANEVLEQAGEFFTNERTSTIYSPIESNKE